jgi:hypothetical protein
LTPITRVVRTTSARPKTSATTGASGG